MSFISVLLCWCKRILNRLDLKYTHCLFLNFSLAHRLHCRRSLDFHYYFADASRLHERKCGFELCRWESPFGKQGFELAIVHEFCRFREDSAEARLTNAR